MKLRYGRIIRRKQIENEKKKISFPPPGDSQSAKTCFFGLFKTTLQNLKFQMGITGAPFGRTELLVPPPEPQERDPARGKGPGLGRWEQVEKCFILGALFFLFCFCVLQRKQNHEIGQTRSDWGHIGSP